MKWCWRRHAISVNNIFIGLSFHAHARDHADLADDTGYAIQDEQGTGKPCLFASKVVTYSLFTHIAIPFAV
jgi:hypothetical protein